MSNMRAGRRCGVIAVCACLGIALFGWLPTRARASSDHMGLVESTAVRVFFEPGHETTASYIVAEAPAIGRELEEATGLAFDFRPTVIPVSTRPRFRLLGGHDGISAFALPDQNQVVVDLSRFDAHPTSLRPVLKHEFAHLLLHRHIASQGLPRWLDEGIAQYLSDGISEYLPDRSSVLGEAFAAKRVFPLAVLTDVFPSDRFGRQLAYEQSRSITLFMVRRYGDHMIPALLRRMAEGANVAEAFADLGGMGLADFEQDWRHHKTAPLSWLGLVAGQVYGLLFFLGALATLIGYLRHRRRRKAYATLEDEDD